MLYNKIKITKKAFTLIEIMCVVTVVMLMAAIAIPVFMRSMNTVQETRAIQNLRAISNAINSYAVDKGVFPGSDVELTSAYPPYLDKNYCDQTNGGFIYKCMIMPEEGDYYIAAAYTSNGAITPRDGKLGFMIDKSGAIIEIPADTVAGSDGTSEH